MYSSVLWMQKKIYIFFSFKYCKACKKKYKIIAAVFFVVKN